MNYYFIWFLHILHFFESLKSKSTQMLRPQKWNSGVSFNDTLLNVGLSSTFCTLIMYTDHCKLLSIMYTDHCKLLSIPMFAATVHIFSRGSVHTGGKELSLCHKLKVPYPYFFAVNVTWWCNPLIFQWIAWDEKIRAWSYVVSRPSLAHPSLAPPHPPD